jgi:hypothetical protein
VLRVPNTAATIITNETIRGKETNCSFRMHIKREIPDVARLNVVSDSAACSNIISGPHEYFYLTGHAIAVLYQHKNNADAGAEK